MLIFVFFHMVNDLFKIIAGLIGYGGVFSYYQRYQNPMNLVILETKAIFNKVTLVCSYTMTANVLWRNFTTQKQQMVSRLTLLKIKYQTSWFSGSCTDDFSPFPQNYNEIIYQCFLTMPYPSASPKSVLWFCFLSL